MSKIKERPILFSAPMVRAILEGRKTVTRRALKMPHGFWETSATGELVPIPANCPYGKSGDRLWVRETWAGPLVDEDQMHLVEMNGWDSFRKPEHCQYRASGGTAEFFDYAKDETVCRWTPSIHMPRWASRILLEITDVRVERLRDITEEQAKAEGVQLYTDHAELGDWWHVEGIETYSADPRKSFELLWSSVGGDWNANPWVWVVEFKRVTP